MEKHRYNLNPQIKRHKPTVFSFNGGLSPIAYNLHGDVVLLFLKEVA